MARESLTVIKLNPHGEEVWQYRGEVIHKTEDTIVIEAFFNREDLLFEGILLKRGDRFIESYDRNHWYNVFKIYDRDDGSLKAWYCNVTTPAKFEEGVIRYIDLALDLFVTPDGKQKLLDEDEFNSLELDEATRKRAWGAVQELRNLFRDGQVPVIEPEA